MRFWPWSKTKSVKASAPARVLRARYDAAQTTADNRRHWANADGLSPNTAMSAEVRRVLRNRARYEVANNSYARGIVLTLANDVVGTGPGLQMLLEDAGVNRIIEESFAAWADAVGLAQKLRTMRMSRAESGEVFALMVNNPEIDHPIQLDLRLVEAVRIASPSAAPVMIPSSGRLPEIDGIVFDAVGNPIEYHLLRYHPGDLHFWSAGREYERIPAETMIHYFRPDRPEQARGVPDITPALPLFAQLRRYTLAVLAAAESAANISIVMKTNIPAGGEAAEVEPMTEMEMVPNTALFSPEGWEPSQIKAEQPATTYEMFKREILNEIARCLNMPFNVAAGNSSGYNYASGRLDHQTYFKSIHIEQSHLEAVVLDRLLHAWLAEAVLIEGLLPQSMRTLSASKERLRGSHQWFWDGHEHVDPAKEANAQAQRLANHTTTLAAEYARQGKDWETQLRQRAREQALMRELGLQEQPVPNPAQTSDTRDEDEDIQVLKEDR